MSVDIKEKMVQLRQALAETIRLDIASPDLFAQQTTQLLNSMENVKIQASRELERLREKIGECQGQISAADFLQSQLIEIVAAFNRMELKRREEEVRLEAERRAHAPAPPPPPPASQGQEVSVTQPAPEPPPAEPVPSDRTVTPRGKRRGTR